MNRPRQNRSLCLQPGEKYLCIVCVLAYLISGGLFHPGDDNQEIAFRYAVDKINTDKSILPRSKLTAQVEIISPQDSFHASKRGDFFIRIILL